MRRGLGIGLGVATHLFFFVTVWRLLPFLAGELHVTGSLWIDLALAGQFAVVHSLLLHPAVRRRLEPIVGDSFYGCFFCVATCITLWLVFTFWRSSPRVVWQFTGWTARVIDLAYVGSWIVLFYSLSLTGFGYQTGFTPWWHWIRGSRPPRRRFSPRGAYLLLRHPVYLCFLGLIWFHPVATLDRTVLLAVWTTYVMVGSVLKDRRLAFYVGAPYLEYQSRVPGYLLMPYGPLARIPVRSDSPSPPYATPSKSLAVAS